MFYLRSKHPFSLFILLLLSFPLFSQVPSAGKGRISLQFDDETIDLPVTAVTLKKDNQIVLSAFAETEDSLVQQSFTLNLGFNKLTAGKGGETLEGTGFSVVSRNKIKQTGKEFSCWLSENNEQKQRYITYKPGEYLTRELQSVQMVINILDISYKDNSLRITGEFKGKFNLRGGDAATGFADFKNGRFEIVI